MPTTIAAPVPVKRTPLVIRSLVRLTDQMWTRGPARPLQPCEGSCGGTVGGDGFHNVETKVAFCAACAADHIKVLEHTNQDPKRKEYSDGYSEAQLQEGLSAVANPKDWKDEINKVLFGLDPTSSAGAYKLALIDYAVSFYTATLADFTFTQPLRTGGIRVRADGYRMGPAGDH